MLVRNLDFEKELFGYSESPFLEDFWFKDWFFDDGVKKREINSKKLFIDYSIKNFSNKKIENRFIIKNYKNNPNYVFYRIGFEYFPPKKIVIKDLDDN